MNFRPETPAQRLARNLGDHVLAAETIRSLTGVGQNVVLEIDGLNERQAREVGKASAVLSGCMAMLSDLAEDLGDLQQQLCEQRDAA